MAMSYTNASLIGNWYEDRLDTDRIGCDPRLLRTNNSSEAPIKMERYVDRPFQTVSMETYKRPQPLRPDTNVAMCTASTIEYVMSREPVKSLPRHGPDRDLRELTTTNHTMYGGPFETNHGRLPPRSAPADLRSSSGLVTAGVGSFGRSTKPIRQPQQEKAIGEHLMIGADTDPKQHTFVQRSWRYSRDLSSNGPYGKDLRDQTNWGQNLPGLGATGLGVEKTRLERNYARPNDALSDRLGIWSG